MGINFRAVADGEYSEPEESATLGAPPSCSYCGGTEFSEIEDHGRGLRATCDACGGTMSSATGYWVPELIGSPKNHPKMSPDPSSGGVPGVWAPVLRTDLTTHTAGFWDPRSNWEEDGYETGPIHRGLRLDGNEGGAEAWSKIHDHAPDHEVAHAILNGVTEGGHLGMSWTAHESHARNVAEEGGWHTGPKVSGFGGVNVVVHAAQPHPQHIEQDERILRRNNVTPHHDFEGEVPLKHGAPAHVTGVSWQDTSRMYSREKGFDPERGWVRHDFAQPVQHTALFGDQRAIDTELPEEIHRGIPMRLSPEVHAFVHDPAQPTGDRAQAILDHYHAHHERNHDKPNLGRHWSTEATVAKGFAKTRAYGSSPYEFKLEPGHTQVVFHAATPGPNGLISGQRTMREHEIFGHDHGEREVPVRRNAPLQIRGISWAPNEDGAELTRHDFDQPLKMKAGLVTAMPSRKHTPPDLTFDTYNAPPGSEHYDEAEESHPGWTHHLLRAHTAPVDDDGIARNMVGMIYYSRTPEGAPHPGVGIHDMRTNTGHERQGIASAMQDELRRQHPQHMIDHGARTPAGESWHSQYEDPGDPRLDLDHPDNVHEWKKYRPTELAQDLAEKDLSHHTSGVDWCRHRHAEHCWLPRQAATQGVALYIPQDRGACPWVTASQQQINCPVSEPGPMAGMTMAGAKTDRPKPKPLKRGLGPSHDPRTCPICRQKEHGPVKHHAAPVPPPHPNPSGGRSWYHGTHFDPDEDEDYKERHTTWEPPHPTLDDVPFGFGTDHFHGDPGGELKTPERPPWGQGGHAALHWNTDLGVHFSSLHDVAGGFAAHGRYDTSRIAHTTVHMANPAHYEDEHHLGAHAINWAREQGHRFLPDHPGAHAHFVDGEDDELSEHPASHHYYDYVGDHISPSDSHTREAVSHIDQHGIEKPENHPLDHIDRYLSTHPKREEITEGFRQHLQSKGHDGIIYGNEIEGPKGHPCAITFPDTHIHVHKWEWTNPGQKHMNAPAEPKQSWDQHVGLDADPRYWPAEHQHTAELGFHMIATWADVRNKAKRIRAEGGVNLLVASGEGVGGNVRGDTAVYETQLNYVPGTAKVGFWTCGCAWAAYAWGRSPAYRRFEGRMCSHALALQFEAQSRGMFGKEVRPDEQRPKWLRQRTPVQTRYDRDTGQGERRRAVPPANMRRTYEGALTLDEMRQEFTDGVVRKFEELSGHEWPPRTGGADVYAADHALDLLRPPVYAFVVDALSQGADPAEAMGAMLTAGLAHTAARSLLREAQADPLAAITPETLQAATEALRASTAANTFSADDVWRHAGVEGDPHLGSPHQELSTYKHDPENAQFTLQHVPLNRLRQHTIEGFEPLPKYRELDDGDPDDRERLDSLEQMHPDDMAPGIAVQHGSHHLLLDGRHRAAILERAGHTHMRVFTTPSDEGKDIFRHGAKTTAGYDPYGEWDGREDDEESQAHSQDWDDIHSGIEEMHRGVGVMLHPHDHAIVHDESRPVHERAHHLLNVMRRHQAEPGIGTHWTTSKGVADDFADGHLTRQLASDSKRDHMQRGDHTWGHDSEGDPKGQPATAVMFHAHQPDRDQIDEHPDEFAHGSSSIYGYHDHGEREVPIHPGGSLELKGISWKKKYDDFDEPEGHDDLSYTRHDFPEPHHVTAKAEPDGAYYHGTRHVLRPGQVLTGGHAPSNQGYAQPNPHVHYADTREVASLFAEMGNGPDHDIDATPRVYQVQPGPHHEDDPLETDHGAYRNSSFKVIKEVPYDHEGVDRFYRQGAKAEPEDDAPTHAGLVLKAQDTGRVLMLQRSLEDEDDPARGTWEWPGGGIEPHDSSSLHGAAREFAEEIGQRVPHGGTLQHVWRSGPYVGHVMVIPSEDHITLHEGRVVPNPDDPDGDHAEQAAWWDPEHARKNPALREECKASPWKAIKEASRGKVASYDDLATSPTITRGIVLGNADGTVWRPDEALRISRGQARPGDLLRHLHRTDVGDFWHGHHNSLADAKVYAESDGTDHVGHEVGHPDAFYEGEDGSRGHIGDVGVVLEAHRPRGWDPNKNPDDGMMGNSYLSHPTELRLHKIHYNDHHGDWHSVDAGGATVHTTGYDKSLPKHYEGSVRTAEVSDEVRARIERIRAERAQAWERRRAQSPRTQDDVWNSLGFKPDTRPAPEPVVHRPERVDGHTYSLRDVDRAHTWEGFDHHELEGLVAQPSKALFTREHVPLHSLRYRDGSPIVSAHEMRSQDEEGDEEGEGARIDSIHEGGDAVPPAIVVRQGQHHIVLDGTHRAGAAAERGDTHLEAFVTGPHINHHEAVRRQADFAAQDPLGDFMADPPAQKPNTMPGKDENPASTGFATAADPPAFDAADARSMQMPEMSSFGAQRPSRMSIQDIGDLESGQHDDGGAVRDREFDLDQRQLHYVRRNWDEVREEPLAIRTLDNGYPMQLADGHHRWTVAQEKGERSLPVRYIGPRDDHRTGAVLSLLHDEPEAALPSTDGADDGDDDGWSTYVDPAHQHIPMDYSSGRPDPRDAMKPEINPLESMSPNQVHASVEPGSVEDIVARFQATAAAQALAADTGRGVSGSTSDPTDGDIAAAAREHLQKAGMKDFGFSEQQDLIGEGAADGTRARNLGDLQIEGTHYEALNKALAEQEGISDTEILFV